VKKTKLNKEVRISGIIAADTHYTERTGAAIIMHWMRQIIEQKQLDLGLPNVETGSYADGNFPDVIIYKSQRSTDVLCVIEAKPPYYFDIFDYANLLEPARRKANIRNAPYFATTNFRELAWLSTERANNPTIQIEQQIINKYPLSELRDLNQIEDSKYKDNIIRQLEVFLTQLYEVSSGKQSEPRQPIDELLIYRLHSKIEKLAGYYAPLIEKTFNQNPKFAAQLSKWFAEQNWSFSRQPGDFERAARQAAYLLVNKILFYNLLQLKRPTELDPLQLPEGLSKGAALQKHLQVFFDQVLQIDYGTIYTADFIDSLAFPDIVEVVTEVKELTNILQRYDFSKLGFEVIGNIFQHLIPENERHSLGQYFTSPDIVDLILRFCLKNERDKIIDPACGAGTFLVRAYQHKKLMNQLLPHETILDTLWGTDIAKFPAHLSTINLAINDLSVDKNYPNIIHEDFFALLSNSSGFELPTKWRVARAKTLDVEERLVEYPRWFDCIVGNPPYTRQEEISEVAPATTADKYKGNLIRKALFEISGKQLAAISKRAGIHAYFFVHATKFLHQGGRFGFIVSNPWLDVDYGRGLQEFFLKNYKIIAVIESQVERWFADADINTCIVILEKCSGDEKSAERARNLARFVYLKKPLRYFVPPAQDMWEHQIERLTRIDGLIRSVLAHSSLYENDDFRVLPKPQSELWEEGFNIEENKYTGSKWGKYIRAPGIFFKLLEKGQGLFINLHQTANVHRGFTSGADPWFYVEDATDSADLELKQKRSTKQTAEEVSPQAGFP